MRRIIARAVVLAAGVLTILVAIPTAAQAADQQRFIDTAGESAQPSQSKYGVPASVTIAQAILESGWGDSDLAKKANNYFGMKCHDGQTGPIAVDCVKMNTWECDGKKCWDTKAWFRVYDSVADSFSDHGRNLSENSRYTKAFKHTDDADAFIREVHKGGYATDPKYTDKIVGLMKEFDLYRFNESTNVQQVNATTKKMSHSAAVAKFTENNMDIWSSGKCSDRNNPNCTSFEQINTATVRGAITLTTYSGCKLTLTGGTETGHGDGTYTHWNGYKLDMSLTGCLARYVEANFSYIGGDQWKSPAGNIYYREPDHWDILFYNCGGCDGTESTMALG